MHRILIVGATSLIAEHCARLWVGRPTHLILAARDSNKLARIVQDLKLRSPQSVVEAYSPEFLDPVAIDAFLDDIWKSGPVDIALIAHGSLPQQSDCERYLVLVREALTVNAISPVLFAEGLAARMQMHQRGTVAVIGSVAGDRGRRSNYVYGSAKGLVDRYMQGLRHRFAGTGIKAITIKPGPVDTPMTADLRRPGMKFADPQLVARDIVAGIDAGRGVIYTPWMWRWVMVILRHIPDRIFGRLDI